MVMLCVAMLSVAAGALLLVLLALRRRPRLREHRPARTALLRPLTARLGTGPPPVWEFSVVRC